MGEIDAESGNGFSFDLEPNANPGWDSRDGKTDKLGDVAIMVLINTNHKPINQNFFLEILDIAGTKRNGYYFSFCL